MFSWVSPMTKPHSGPFEPDTRSLHELTGERADTLLQRLLKLIRRVVAGPAFAVRPPATDSADNGTDAPSPSDPTRAAVPSPVAIERWEDEGGAPNKLTEAAEARLWAARSERVRPAAAPLRTAGTGSFGNVSGRPASNDQAPTNRRPS